jgi:hypothetical protein
MKFDNRLKGRLGESILGELLIDAGYTVSRIGIEHTVKEAASLTQKQYKKLRIDSRIKRLPDFLVMDIEGGDALLTEVKSRDSWETIEIVESIFEQVRFYREFILVIFVAHPRKTKFSGASTYLRATKVRASETRGLERAIEFELKDGRMETDPFKIDWYDLPPIQKYFHKLTGRGNENTLEQVTEMFRRCWTAKDE